MQVSRRALLPERLWPDQADSANVLFHRRPVRSTMSTVGVGNDHNNLSWMDKRLDQFSVSNGDDDTAGVTTDDALLGLTANHRATYAPRSTVQWHHSDQQGACSHSAPFETSTAGPWDSQGARPKNKRPPIPNPAHLNADICRGFNHTGIDPWFIARHTQDDYYQNPERVAADLNNRIVHMNSCMREPFTGYDARPLFPDHSEVNGGMPGQNRADPPRVGAGYFGLPLADLQPQQSGNSKYSANRQAAALLNPPTGADGGFLPAQTGSDDFSFFPLAMSEKEVKTTDISTTVTANCEQRVNEPASGSSSSDVSLTSTASFNTAYCESDSDDSLKDLEARVEEACAMVERVLRDREEREEYEKTIKQIEDDIKAKRKREQQARDARELENSKSWPAQQDAVITAVQRQLHCEHYQRCCWVKFACCNVFYPCHRCHNLSKKCSKEKVHAYDATHYQCSKCKHEEKIDENSHHCSSCKISISAYFCSICKHFTSTDKKPYHCEKCGICRIHKDKSFHCDVCNVCLDIRLHNKHKCRPDSGHDECPICLEDAFSGCQILPCSHKVHRECAVMMVQNGVRNCPLCRHPIYSPAPG